MILGRTSSSLMTSKMVLLVGGDSEIGAATAGLLRGQGAPVVTTTRRPERLADNVMLLDLSQPLGAWEPPAGVEAACIFAAIARLAVCADDPEGSARINVDQTLALTERLVTRGIYVLFLSTNQVFDGSIAEVSPEAPTCPVSEYGRQKARTEAALRAMMDGGAPVGILRLAKVVSPDMPLVRGWVSTLKSGQPIRAFHDMPMAPAPTQIVCTAIAKLLQDRAQGVFQLTGPRDVSYLDIGCHVAERVGAPRSLVESISATAAGQPPGSTPRHTTLDSTVLRDRYGLVVPDVWTVVDSIIAAGQPSAPLHALASDRG